MCIRDRAEAKEAEKKAKADAKEAEKKAKAEAKEKAKVDAKAAKEAEKKAKVETKVEAPVAAAASIEDDEEDEEIHTQEIDINGKTYLIDNENNLYSCVTHDEIGKYDASAKSIIAIAP